MLDMTLREIERVLYFEAFVVVDPGHDLAAARPIAHRPRCISSRSKKRDESMRAWRRSGA